MTPWIRLTELVKNHTEFSGPEALYTATIVLVMHRAKYDALPGDLRALIDAEAGAKLSAIAARVMKDNDQPARDIAVVAGNTLVSLDEAEVARWKEAARPVIARWIDDMSARGIDGQALIDRATTLIAGKTG